jgi:2-hydroxy-6-oxonona-2,4-dienedioate hydrolase
MKTATMSKLEAGEERYRAAERRLWESAGVMPAERRLFLPGHRINVRVQELGEGPPTIFLHGGPGAAGSVWVYLAARLPHLRCILVDRPGTGLSDPYPIRHHSELRPHSERFVAELLDALELDHAHVVGSSHGSYMALAAALRHPDRIAGMVHMGCPGFIEGMRETAIDRLVLWPGVAKLFSLMPASEKELRKACRRLGHGPSLDAGRIPQEFFDWGVAVVRDTCTMREDLGLMARLGSFRGFEPSLTIRDDELATLRSPTLLYWGTLDPYGAEDVARRLASIIPDARLEIRSHAGHLPWFDDPQDAAAATTDFLAGVTAAQRNHG